MKRHALFVGVDEYADPTIQNLAFPTKDATDLAGAFEWSLKFNRVEKLLGPEHADDILDAVGDMTTDLGPGDLFFFFFAGHGFRVKDNHVLVCARDNWGDLEDEDAGLRVGRLKKKLRGPWNRMIVLDACQNDIRATRGADCGVTARDLSLIHDGDAAARPGEGVQILVTSCSEGQKALEVADLRHGLFTSAFLETVKTFADGHMFLDSGILKNNLSDRMRSLVVSYRLGGSQEPMFTIPGNTRIVLLDGVSAPPLSPPVSPAFVFCPLCGKKNHPENTFRCRECGRDNLCLRHQDEVSFLCADCAAKARESEAKAAEDAKIAKEKAGAERKAAEKAALEAERRNPKAGTRAVVRVGKMEVAFRWCPPGTRTDGFWMGETPVTQSLWMTVMGSNPSRFKGNDRYPVVGVSWDDCQKFLKELNELDAVLRSGFVFRLPADVEWEHACRAGGTGNYCRLADGTEITSDTLSRVALYGRAWNEGPSIVGSLEPNAWGLFDMHGNVSEWVCSRDGGPPAGRGGGWFFSAGNCTFASQSRYAPDFTGGFLGLRIAATAVPGQKPDSMNAFGGF